MSDNYVDPSWGAFGPGVGETDPAKLAAAVPNYHDGVSPPVTDDEVQQGADLADEAADLAERADDL